MLIRPEILPQGDLSDPSTCAPPTLELAPGFRAPLPTGFDALRDHIERALPAESPVVYGMHPNAELSLLTSLGETLFRTLADVSGGSGGERCGPPGVDTWGPPCDRISWEQVVHCLSEHGRRTHSLGPYERAHVRAHTHNYSRTHANMHAPHTPLPGASGGASSGEAAVRAALKDYSERLPQPFDLVDVEGRVKEKSPYVVVALQEVRDWAGGLVAWRCRGAMLACGGEVLMTVRHLGALSCPAARSRATLPRPPLPLAPPPQATRMNALLEEMRRGMEELQLGLDGALNMSDRMEKLSRGIATNSVPDAWMACMSTRVQEVGFVCLGPGGCPYCCVQ